jgi:hypothetical protein
MATLDLGRTTAPPLEVDVAKPGPAGLVTDYVGAMDHYQSPRPPVASGRRRRRRPRSRDRAAPPRVADDPAPAILRQVHPDHAKLFEDLHDQGFEAPPGQLAEHHHARLGRARPAPRFRLVEGSAVWTPCCPRVARRLERLGLTPGINLADGLRAANRSPNTLDIAGPPQPPVTVRRARRQASDTPGPRQAAQDRTYLRRKYLQAVSHLTAHCPQGRSGRPRPRRSTAAGST